ncbi:MAG: FliM/FliN family flagellar motor switch protein [Acidobacteriia bacterium]|nr:FliM/FliN family flagellar motor switch protein [Terriglobia bacterium]
MAESPVRPDARTTAGVLEEFSEVLDVPMRITLEVGRRSMRVREILLLKPESIVEVPKSAGENIDVYINGKLVAFGEILDIESKTGVRLTDFFVQT